MSIHDNIIRLGQTTTRRATQFGALVALIALLAHLGAPWWSYLLLKLTQLGSITRWLDARRTWEGY